MSIVLPGSREARRLEPTFLPAMKIFLELLMLITLNRKYFLLLRKCTNEDLSCFQMSIANYGVGADGLLAAQSAMSGSSDDYGNDSRVEQLWAMKVNHF